MPGPFHSPLPRPHHGVRAVSNSQRPSDDYQTNLDEVGRESKNRDSQDVTKIIIPTYMQRKVEVCWIVTNISISRRVNC